MNTYYIKVKGKSMPVIFTRRAKEAAALNFLENILFVIETCGSLLEDRVMSIRNRAFDYDMLVLLSTETDEIVVLGFSDINERHKIDIDFSLDMLIA